MTFSEIHRHLPVEALVQQSKDTTPSTVERILTRGYAENIREFAALISPAAQEYLEQMAQLAHGLTAKHFGKAIRLFAPIYLSNECVNICKYCGFSRNLDIPRITIPVSQAVRETRLLAEQGFRSLLIVAGEHPKYVSNGYVEEVVRECLEIMPSIALELGPMETRGYLPLVEAGCEALVVYQETYDEPTYKDLHPSGPKKKYAWRMDTAERAYEAGFRRLGIGALFGLADWHYEAISLAAHALHLTRKCWKAQLSLSFPRMRPAAGGFQVDEKHDIKDRELVQLICASRLLLPHAAFVLSTRESPRLRENLLPLGITTMSAGSSTEPGGYSSYDIDHWAPKEDQEAEQFQIADERSPAAVAEMIRSRGYEAVWKDFDQSLVAST
jgi:2-iminoacetate synthase